MKETRTAISDIFADKCVCVLRYFWIRVLYHLRHAADCFFQTMLCSLITFYLLICFWFSLDAFVSGSDVGI